MPKRKTILIGCPQYAILVRGSYECDERGRYLLGANGEFLLERVRCGQYGGRCMETLCVLHRYNRRKAGSWYPAGVYAMPQKGREAPRPAGRAGLVGGWYA